MSEGNGLSKESFITKVIADFRITIPKKIRQKLSLQQGDFVEVKILRKFSNSEREVS